MSSWDDVRRAAMAMPGVTEDGSSWKVRDKTFLWERPLRKGDLAELGLDEQPGPVLGMRVADEGVKRALIEDDPEVFFTTRHFDGYPAVLIWLDALTDEDLREVVEEAWLSRAPKRLIKEYGPPPS